MQKLVTTNIKYERLGLDTYTYNNLPTNQLSPQEPQCAMWLHIYRMQWKRGTYAWAFLDIEGASDSTSNDIINAVTWHELGDTLMMGWLLAGWQRNYSHSQEKHRRGLWLTAVHRGAVYYTISVKPGCRWTHKRTRCDKREYVLS
jgi:hypothetical protein